MNSVFSLLWNIWMQREFVGIDNADFNRELVQGFVSSWSTSTVVCVGILTQLTFEGIWIGSNRSPTTVIGRRLGRSVPKSVESGTTSQEGILIEVGKNNRLCWYCFYLLWPSLTISGYPCPPLSLSSSLSAHQPCTTKFNYPLYTRGFLSNCFKITRHFYW